MEGTAATAIARRERARRAVELAEALLREARAGQTTGRAGAGASAWRG